MQEQASWVCGCPSEPVARLEEELKARLEQEASLEGWAAWLEQVVDRTLAPLAATAAEPAAFTRGARQFLLRYRRQGVHDKDARPERLFTVAFFRALIQTKDFFF